MTTATVAQNPAKTITGGGMCPPTDAAASTPPALNGLPVEFTVSGAKVDESRYCWAHFRPTATLTTAEQGRR